jgi:hypothetical protein
MGQDNLVPTKAKAGDHKGEMACVVTSMGGTLTEAEVRTAEKKIFDEVKNTPEYKTATPHQKQNFARHQAEALSMPCAEMQTLMNEAESRRKTEPVGPPTEIQEKVNKAADEIKEQHKRQKATLGFHP